ncbi:DNA-binding protein [Nonomuraea sp. NPDC052634]|uniref:DNA-binding protein n=1 Tax=Nonomuraea sp. NPDC052634 TaxID=3155813 RepID=UPI003414353B
MRVGKKYRIAEDDLAAFAGLPAERPLSPRRAEATSVVQVDGIDRAGMDRIGTMVLGALSAERSGLRVEFAYDEERAQLKIIVLGGLEETAQVLRIVDALVRP